MKPDASPSPSLFSRSSGRAPNAATRLIYPKPEEFESSSDPPDSSGTFSRSFWLYLAGAALGAAGFADFSLIAFHFKRTGVVPAIWIPIFYSVAMAVSGLGSLVFGRFFDQRGLRVLIPLTIVTAVAAPFVFLGRFPIAHLGAGLWGLGMGVHESIIPAAVATMVPAAKRPTAYGLFTGAYGVVSRQRADWLAVRTLAARGSRLLRAGAACCDPIFPPLKARPGRGTMTLGLPRNGGQRQKDRSKAAPA